MAGGDGKPKAPPKPGAPAGPRPVAQQHKPRGTSDSIFDLAPVGSVSKPVLPRVPTSSQPAARNPFGNDEKTSTSMQNLPKVGGASSQNLPRVGASSQNLAPVGPQPGLTARPARRKTNIFQKRLASSGFDEEERTESEAILGKSKSVELDLDEVHTAPIEYFDGETPADGVMDKETWRAVKPQVTSAPRRRAGRVLWTLIDQFACGHNPRYTVNNPAADPRAHVFAWDVSLAMGVEIPHNRSGREMTLAQTADWFRFESHNRGWKKVDQAGALAAAERGELVYVIAKDPKVRALAVVRPGGVGDDGKPRVASAGRPKGNDLSVTEAVGVEVDYFTHP